jgi:peroxiredoxin
MFLVSVGGLLLVSTGVNALQAQRIHSLLAATRTGASIVGQMAVPLVGETLDGQRVRLTFNRRRPTVLYYFSGACTWCERNWANVEALDDAASGRYRLVAVSAERGLAEYVRRRNVRLEVVEGISENVRAAFGFYGTPHTVVIDAEGVVTHEWRGAFSPRIERQISELFEISLPGLQSTTSRRIAE